jgi:hypothetical protein
MPRTHMDMHTDTHVEGGEQARRVGAQQNVREPAHNKAAGHIVGL